MSKPIVMTQATARQTATVERDVKFFQRNPHIRAYERRATKTEQRDFGLPPYAMCFVIKVSKRHHIRAFRVPDERRN